MGSRKNQKRFKQNKHITKVKCQKFSLQHLWLLTQMQKDHLPGLFIQVTESMISGLTQHYIQWSSSGLNKVSDVEQQ